MIIKLALYIQILCEVCIVFIFELTMTRKFITSTKVYLIDRKESDLKESDADYIYKNERH